MLNILNITPINNSINIPIDSEFLIEFDQPVDPFSIGFGINIYTIGDGIWSGPDLAILDTKLDTPATYGEFQPYEFSYNINNNRIYIKTSKALMPERIHYISILPGNDATRFVSKPTFSAPVYERIATSSGILEVVSSYVGSENTTYIIDIVGVDKIDVIKGTQYINEFTFTNRQEIDLGDIKVSLTGTFDIGDTINIDVFKAEGLESIFKTTFTTAKYTTFNPQSQSLTVPPGNILNQESIPFKIVKTIPENMSIDNNRYNPITIKFNKNIDTHQNIMDKIRITKTDFTTSKKVDISYYYKINGDTIKIYLT